MKLSDVAAAVGGATAGEVWTYSDRTLTEITGTPRENLVGTNAPILSDGVPFPGANIDAAISSRAVAGDSPDPAYYTTTRATKLDNLDALVSSRATQGDILSDATPFPGANIDAAISSRAVADDSPDPSYYTTTRATKLDNLDAAVSSRSSHSAADVWAVATRTLTGITGTPRSDIIGADEPLYTYYSTARAIKLDHLDADISSRATPADSPDPAYYTTTRATKLDYLDAAVSSRSSHSAADVWAVATRTLTGITGTPRSDIIGANEPLYTYYSTARAQKLDHLDADISSRATPSDSPDPTYYSTTRATKLDNLDVAVSSRATQGDILSDATPFPGANIDAAISSRATPSDSPDPAYYTTTRATKLDHLDADISSRAVAADSPDPAYYTTTRATKLDFLDASVSSRSSHSAADVWAVGTRTLTGFTGTPRSDLVGADEPVYTRLDVAVSTRATAGDSPDPAYYTTTRATKLDNLDVAISSRATPNDSPDPAYYTTTRATKLDNLDALISSRATQGDILSDGTPFPGANIDVAISSRAVADDSPDPSYYTTTRATKLDYLDASISSRATAGDSPDPAYYTTARAVKLDYLDCWKRKVLG